MDERDGIGWAGVFSRRRFLGAVGLGVAGAALWAGMTRWPTLGPSWRVPAETTLHVRCWMAWPSSTSIWSETLLPRIQGDIALIARTIARYEPVVMCADGSVAAMTARSACGPAVDVITTIAVDDFWMRDSGPVFRVDDAGSRDAVGLNFNGWGHKQTYTKDQAVAGQVASYAGARFANAAFVSEGGAIECDGDGTLIATESSVVNPNRNPGMSKAQLESEMKAAYGARKVLWVRGVEGRDITDGHIDATSRFVRPGVVLLQLPPPDRTDLWAEEAREQYQILSSATDARGRHLQVVTLEGPDTVRSNNPDFLDSYVNFYPANGAIITAQFGDSAKDGAARATLESMFPGRRVEQLNLDALYGEGGGGVHCVTQQEPVAM